jgi:hypothetical protein
MVCESVGWLARESMAIGVKTPRLYGACHPEKPAKPDQNIILSGSLTRGNPLTKLDLGRFDAVLTR